MPKLPLVSGANAVRRFERAGWSVARQKESHVMMTRPGTNVTLAVPQRRELDRGLLRMLIRAVGLSVDDFDGLR